MPIPLLVSTGEDLREFALANSLAAQQGGPGSRLLWGYEHCVSAIPLGGRPSERAF